tara:strand:- start:2217 stop:2714 length:498 start_codon:yes stop_codon:yes gene_type:complete
MLTNKIDGKRDQSMDEFIESLLNTWRDKGKFGLTLPFLEGALRLKGFSTGMVATSFNSMLNELQDAESFYRLSYCDKANDLILAPVKSHPSECKRISKSGTPTSLWVQHNLIGSDNTDTSELYKVLWKKYGAVLEAELYSCNKGDYHKFTSEDLALIEEAYGKIA